MKDDPTGPGADNLDRFGGFQPNRREVVVGSAALVTLAGAPISAAAQDAAAAKPGGFAVLTRLVVNGTEHALQLDSRSSLLDVLRKPTLRALVDTIKSS